MLVFSATTSALTGFMLAAMTTWGFFHHWWVTAKFVITFTQLYLGIFVLAAAMPDVVAAAANGHDGPAGMVALGAALMAGALSFQAWLSIAKPWGRTRYAERADVRPTGAPGWLLVIAVLAPIADIPLGVALIEVTDPSPALSLAVLATALVSRTRRHRAARSRRAPARTFPAVVAVVESITDDVRTLRVARADGTPVPEWAPGAHIDLVLPSGKTRQYSLHGNPADRAGYDVAVLLEPEGRGGSIEIHGLREGQPIEVGGPRNNFPLTDATYYLFVAGGIGVTPLIPMIEQVAASGRPWILLYRGRSLHQMPFAATLKARHGDHVRLRPSDSTPRPDLPTQLARLPRGAAVYCCGPTTLMDAVEEAMTACPQGVLHLERFVPTAKDENAVDTPFEVELRYSNRTVAVPADRTMLDAMRDVLPDLPASCETGLCGSCKVSVLAGRPDHRDDILLGPDRERTDIVYPCVSRSRDAKLVIDA